MFSRFRSTLSGAAVAGLFCALAAGACSDPTGPGKPGGITVVATPAADSILAFPAQALVVEVRDSAGKLRPGINVQFAAVPVPFNGSQIAGVFVGDLTGNFAALAVATTDQSGRAAVLLRMGPVAGEGRVNISAPTLGFGASAAFTVRPGNPVRLTVSPADSAMYVGRAYALRAALADRWGNAITGQSVAYSVEGTAATLAGGTLTGQSVGRVRVVAQAGGLTGEAFASVVPQATLLAARGDGLYAFGADGSEMRRVVAAQDPRSPRWFPDGQRFVYSTGAGHAWVGDANGSTRRLLPAGTSLAWELWAHPSRDGQWVYFGGYDFSYAGRPYRVRADGTELSLVPGFTSDGFTYGHPSVSPTGDRVAMFRERSHSRDVLVRVQSLSTGALSFPEIEGHQPEWSHGDSIAFLETQGNETGPIRIMGSNGGGLRAATFDGQRRYHFGIEWSPDDKWIVARAADTGFLELIEVATGRTLPLGYTYGLYDAAWRP